MKANILLIFLTALTLGCKEILPDAQDREDAHLMKVATGARVFDGDPEPKYPERPDETLEGVDVDKDGVRDDIEIWINETFQKPNERKAWKQYTAANLEHFQFLEDRGKSIKHTNEVDFPSLNCLSFIYEMDIHQVERIRKKYSARFFNTYDRIKASDKSSKNYSGQSGLKDSPFEGYKHCKFEIENFEVIKQNGLKAK